MGKVKDKDVGIREVTGIVSEKQPRHGEEKGEEGKSRGQSPENPEGPDGGRPRGAGGGPAGNKLRRGTRETEV